MFDSVKNDLQKDKKKFKQRINEEAYHVQSGPETEDMGYPNSDDDDPLMNVTEALEEKNKEKVAEALGINSELPMPGDEKYTK